MCFSSINTTPATAAAEENKTLPQPAAPSLSLHLLLLAHQSNFLYIVPTTTTSIKKTFCML